jgi:RNA polymerase sigma-70 factor, ECF subfamily
MASVTQTTISTVWRIEAPRLIGGLVRFVRDVDRAEDLAQEALVAALETWPETGIPANPGAWLMATAKNRAIDAVRREKLAAHKHTELAHQLESTQASVRQPEVDDSNVGDDVLRLMLVACHPVLARDARAALTLRLLGGLSTIEIARAFLTPEATIAQRIVRAKRTLTEAKVPFDVPAGDELGARIPGVLEVIYLIFNEGYAASHGEDLMRPELCQDALRLGRMLAALAPHEAEVHGLVALMELHASRMRTRVNSKGEPILLLDQDRARWDYTLIHRGLAALDRAERLRHPLGPYTLQAALSACHARARTAGETDWHRIVAIYDALVEMTHSPIVELNRAVAIGMAYGPAPALELVDELASEPVLAGYHLVPAVRGDLLLKLGRNGEARAEFERAAFLTTNQRERDLLVSRAKSC